MRGFGRVGNLDLVGCGSEFRRPIRLAVEHQAVGVVAQPIQRRRGEQRLAGKAWSHSVKSRLLVTMVAAVS